MACKPLKLDFSLFPFPSALPEDMATWEMVLKCCVMGLIILFGVIGNALIIIIVCVSKKMHTTINLYISNLAVADLIVACFPTWIYITTHVTNGWILGEFICKFNAFVQGKTKSLGFHKYIPDIDLAGAHCCNEKYFQTKINQLPLAQEAPATIGNESVY